MNFNMFIELVHSHDLRQHASSSQQDSTWMKIEFHFSRIYFFVLVSKKLVIFFFFFLNSNK